MAQQLLQTLNNALKREDGMELLHIVGQGLSVEQVMKKSWLVTLNVDQLPKMCAQHVNNANHREFSTCFVNTMISVKKSGMEAGFNQLATLLK